MADWDDGEAAALRAALATMEDWDGDLDSLCGLTSDSSSGSDAGHRKKSKTRETVAPYKQRKQEIDALKAEVEELQNALELEKVLIIASRTREPTMEETALDLEWERMAAAQKQQRFMAQMENATLRELLQSQRKNAEKMFSLDKRVKLTEDALKAPPVASFWDYRMPDIDAQEHLQGLNDEVSNALKIFSSGSFTVEDQQCFREAHFRDSTPAVNGVELDIEVAWVLPFEVERVADAVWLQTTRPSFRQQAVTFMGVYEDANALVSQFIATTPPGEDWGASQGQMAAKRFPPDLANGSFLIGITTQARAYSSDGSKWTASMNMQGWLQISSIGSNASTPLTQIKWHRRVIAKPPDIAAFNDSERCKWTHTMVAGPSRSNFEKDLEWSVQTIENMLLAPR